MVYQEDGTVVPSLNHAYLNFQNSSTVVGAGASVYLKIDTTGWRYGYVP